MSREIRKKVIDQDIPDPGDFDEKMLEQIEKEFDQVSLTGGNLKGTTQATGIGPSSEAPSQTQFSLDDFETSFGMGEEASKEGPQEQPVSPPTVTPSPGKVLGRRFARNKMIIIGSAALLLLLGTGFLLHRLLHKPEAPQVMRMVKHRIDVPFFQERFDLFLLANAQKERNLLTMGIEFEFPAVNAMEEFQKENVVFRDVVYQFLQGEHPVKNSQKYWQQIVERNLYEFLKTIFPNCGLSAIRMVYLDRL